MTERPDSKRSLPPVLRFLLLWIIALTAICLSVEYYCRHSPNLNHLPYTHYTLDPSDDYADYRMFVGRFRHFNQQDFFSPKWGSHFLYPATVGVISAPFYMFPPHNGHNRFLLVLLLCMVFLMLWFRRVLIRRGLSNAAATIFALTISLLSYPFHFEYNRANVEFYIWIITGLGIIAFLRDKPWRAATWIGIAGACKFYPFLYVGLLIARKQYKQAAWALCVGVLFTLFSLWALTGNLVLTQRATSAGLEEFRWLYVLHKRVGEIGLDHSFFGFYKRFAAYIPPPDQLAHQLSIVLAVTAVIACVAWFARATKLPVINQIIFLTVAAITLPPVSYDYTLLHVYTPFILMVFLAIDYWQRGVPLPRGAWAAFVCFMLLLAPLNEFVLHGERVSGQLKCLVLLALAGIALCYPFVSEKAVRPAEAV